MTASIRSLLCTTLLVAGCASPNPLQPFDRIEVAVSAAGDGSGSVAATEPAVRIDCRITDGTTSGTLCNTTLNDAGAGGRFDLIATEDEDSEFTGWTGCVSAVRNICTLSFESGVGNARFTVTANFRKRAGIAGGYNMNLLQNPSFEELVAIGTLPSGTGFWQGDEAGSVVPPAGISRVDGNQVLQFRFTGPSQPSATGVSSQQWQLIDVSALASDIDAGKVRATAKARFASVIGDAETDRRFDLRVGAFTGRPSDFPSAYVAPEGVRLADPVVSVITAPGAWLPAELSFVLPAGTRYLAVEIYAYENVVNDTTDPEFDGHFADETSLILRRIP